MLYHYLYKVYFCHNVDLEVGPLCNLNTGARSVLITSSAFNFSTKSLDAPQNRGNNPNAKQ